MHDLLDLMQFLAVVNGKQIEHQEVHFVTEHEVSGQIEQQVLSHFIRGEVD